MEGSKILLCSSNFSWAREVIFSTCIDNSGTRLHKASSSLFQTINMNLQIKHSSAQY
jgi:hypothetical protein